MKVRRYLDILQVFRGVAALMVVVHHSVGSLKYYLNINDALISFIGSIGKYGVDFFFILSGFIIAYSAYFKKNDQYAFKQYVVNRITRIYVPYLPLGILMLLLYTYLPSLSSVNREISALTSLTLLPDGNPALSVAWTLTFEIVFYLVFGLSFLSRRCLNYFFISWSLGIILIQILIHFDVTEVNSPFLNLICSLYNLEFILGYLLSILVINDLNCKKAVLYAFAFFFLTLYIYSFCYKIELFKFYLNTIFSLFVFSILLLSITKYNISLKRQSLFMIIGNSSYSIYLLHNPIQSQIIKLFTKLKFEFNPYMLLLLIIVVSVSFGYVYYIFFEKYLTIKVKKIILKE